MQQRNFLSLSLNLDMVLSDLALGGLTYVLQS